VNSMQSLIASRLLHQLIDVCIRWEISALASKYVLRSVHELCRAFACSKTSCDLKNRMKRR